MNDTPRTDAQAQTVFTDAGTINAVPQDFARTLERENALLVEQNERMRQALQECISEMNDAAKYIQERSTLSSNAYADALQDVIVVARSALNPPPTK